MYFTSGKSRAFETLIQGKPGFDHFDNGGCAEHKKYVSNRKSYAQIRWVSDRLCTENGLSVVIPGMNRGKQYAEWDARRKGTSYKQKLKIAIENSIKAQQSAGYERWAKIENLKRAARTMVFLEWHCSLRRFGAESHGVPPIRFGAADEAQKPIRN